mgnify:FL=1|tara:strand:- start:1056 stop:1256 length:201 start_codon:yes stop_codon:yes gene_type:complete
MDTTDYIDNETGDIIDGQLEQLLKNAGVYDRLSNEQKTGLLVKSAYSESPLTSVAHAVGNLFKHGA